MTPTPNNSWHGQLDLQFARQTTDQLHQKTQLIRSYARAPLKVQRPFYPEPEVCHTVLLHTAGGMVGGDRLSYRLTLHPHAQTLITTATAAKIYRSNGQIASQIVDVELGEHACLEWLPQDTIIFDQAAYHQTMRVQLSPGAIWCGWEITRLGRSASQEKFTQGQWQNMVEVWQAGKPLWIDRQQFFGHTGQWQTLHGLTNQPIVGTLAIMGVNVSPALVKKARSLWNSDEQKISYGVSKVRGGLICRYRGSDSQTVRRWFIAVWDSIRQEYWGRSACIPRVWQI